MTQKLNKSQLFSHVHAIVRCKNIAYYGSYQKAFGAVLKQCYADRLVYGWSV